MNNEVDIDSIIDELYTLKPGGRATAKAAIERKIQEARIDELHNFGSCFLTGDADYVSVKDLEEYYHHSIQHTTGDKYE